MINNLILGFKRIVREKPETLIAIASGGITMGICRWKKKDWAETMEIGHDVGSLAHQSARIAKKLRSRDPLPD